MTTTNPYMKRIRNKLTAAAAACALLGAPLMHSVFERTREIGLLLAVGMKRRQVRIMIRSEAVILAIFSAIIGIIVGTGMGIALVSSLNSRASPTPSCQPPTSSTSCSPPCSA